MPPKQEKGEEREPSGRCRTQEEIAGPGGGRGGSFPHSSNRGRKIEGEDLRWTPAHASGASATQSPLWRATGLRSIAIQIPSQASSEDNDALASSRASTASTWTPRTSGSGTPFRSPEAATPRGEEGQTRKKQRLGWGEGLAKYERKKSGGAEDEAGPSNIATLPQSASPTSPLPVRVPQGYSPGKVDDSSLKLLDTTGGNQFGQPSCSGVTDVSQETLLSSLLLDVYSGASSSLRHAAMSKLLVMKDKISKELEETENDIDILEGKFRSMYHDLEASPRKISFLNSAAAVSEHAVNDVSEVSLPGNPLIIATSGVNLAEGEKINVSASVEKHPEVESVDDGCLNADSAEVSEVPVSKNEILYSHRGEIPDISELMAECPGTSDHTVNLSPDRQENGAVGVVSVEGLYRQCASNLTDSITASNKDIAKHASQVFDKLVPACSIDFDPWDLVSFLSLKDNKAVKEKLFNLQSFLKFKQKALAIKYRLTYSMCLNDVQLLSIKKPSTNSRKRLDLKKRLKVKGASKVRPDFPSSLPSVGKQTLTSTREGMNFAAKLMLESKINIYRPYLKMPACVPLEERRYVGIISNNALIEDPITYEKEKNMINPWNQEEKQLFLEMLATYGKDFSKIASFLKHKTTADCVEFYYKNHKSEIFDDVKKKRLVLKRSEHLPVNSYLDTLGRKWKPATNAFSLQILQPPEACLSQGDASGVRQICIQKSNLKTIEHMARHQTGPSEREATSSNALAGYGATPCDAMSSCITSSISPAEKAYCRKINWSLLADISHSIEEEEICSDDDGCGEVAYFDWTDEEKSMFVKALTLYGKDFTQISKYVGSRTKEQCKVFFCKARKSLGLDAVHRRKENSGTLWGDTIGEKIDAEDACAAEMDSGICSTQSCSKADTDSMQLLLNTGREGFTRTADVSIQLDTEISCDHDDDGGSIVDEDEIKDDEEALIFSRESALDENPIHSTPNNVVEVGCSDIVNNEEDPNQYFKEAMKDTIVASGDSTLTDNSDTKIQLEYVVSHDVPVGCSSPIQENVKVDLEQCVLPKGKSANKLQEEFLMNTSIVEDTVIQSTPDEISSGYGKLPPVEEVNDLNCPKSLCTFQAIIPCKLLPDGACNFVVPDKKEALSFPILLTKPSSICLDEHLESFSEPAPDYRKHGNKKTKNSLTSESSQDYLLDYLGRNVQILKGHPLLRLNRRDACNGFADKKKRKNGTAQSTKLSRMHVSDSKFENCAVSRFSLSICEAVCASKSEEMSDTQLRPCSQSVCLDNEAESRLKLFGKNLSHPSSPKNSKLLSNGDSNKLLLPKQVKCPVMKPSSLKKVTTDPSILPQSSYGSLVADGQTSSYCSWDGSMWKGLQEAACSLDPYRGQNGGGGSLYSAKHGFPCNGGVLARFQEEYLQELHSRNGINVQSAAMQQPSRTGSFGMSLADGSAVIVGDGGGSCSGVSDPVAAIKMYFSTRAKILGEVNSCPGDVGR